MQRGMIKRSWISGAGLGVAVLSASAATAQPASTELQLDRLLLGPAVVLPSVQGPVWQITPPPGRQLVSLPMLLTPGNEPQTFGDPQQVIQGSRFVAWNLSTPTAGTGRGVALDIQPSDEELQDLGEALSQLDRGDASAAGGNASLDLDSASAILSDVDADTPRLARTITLLPSGDVTWPLERMIPGGVVASGESVFHLYLDRARLDALEPQEPARPERTAGESSRDYRLRERALTMEFRQQQALFRELNRAVRDAPQSFSQPIPPTVGAIFEVSQYEPQLRLRGTPDGDWQISFVELEALQQLASAAVSGGGAQGELSDQAKELISKVSSLAESPHPWSQRLLAEAIQRSELASVVSSGDSGFELLQDMLASPDEAARRRTVYAVASVRPATPAVAELLTAAARNLDNPAVRQAALRARLSVQWHQPDTAAAYRGAVSVAQQELANPQSMAPQRVIEALLASVPEAPEAEQALITTLSFTQIPADSRRAAVSAALRSAGVSPRVVGGWVDRQLLGSPDAGLARLTLELLSEVQEPAEILRPVSRSLTTWLLGPADHTSTPLILGAKLPLTSTTHAIFRSLQAGDDEIKSLAWESLKHFAVNDGPASRSDASTADSSAAVIDLVMQLALGSAETPEGVVGFLASQSDSPASTSGLLAVVIRGNAEASKRAARALVGSGREIADSLKAMTPQERADFGEKIYDRLGRGPQPVAGLLGSPTHGDKLATWFGQQLSEGSLPPADQWATQVGDRRALLQVVGEAADAPAAGAIAAMAASAGADATTQQQLIERFKDSRRSLSADDLQSAWDDAQRDIYRRQLAGLSGSYVLMMKVGDAGEAEPRVLGLARLIADARQVRFQGGKPELTVPPDFLALRIETPSQLKETGVKPLETLALEDVDQPLDLRPQEDGSWSGAIELSDGKPFELMLRPATPDEERNGVKPTPAKDEGERPRNAFR